MRKNALKPLASAMIATLYAASAHATLPDSNIYIQNVGQASFQTFYDYIWKGAGKGSAGNEWKEGDELGPAEYGGAIFAEGHAATIQKVTLDATVGGLTLKGSSDLKDGYLRRENSISPFE